MCPSLRAFGLQLGPKLLPHGSTSGLWRMLRSCWIEAVHLENFGPASEKFNYHIPLWLRWLWQLSRLRPLGSCVGCSGKNKCWMGTVGTIVWQSGHQKMESPSPSTPPKGAGLTDLSASTAAKLTHLGTVGAGGFLRVKMGEQLDRSPHS